MYKETAKKYDRIFQFNPKVIELVEELLSKIPSTILDVGCGTGKYIGFLSKDHRVTGIDPDGASIELAKKHFPRAQFVVGDLFAFETDEQFDLIFSVGNVLSHIHTNELELFVRRVHSLLRQGSVWMFHTMNWDLILKRNDYNFPVIERDDLKFERKYENISVEGVDFITRLTEHSGRIIEQSIRLYPQTEKRLLQLHHDFELKGLYADYGKNPVGPATNSKVFIFRKI